MRRTPGLRVRPVPELGTCIVYTPASPRLHKLNPTAWLALELVDGRPSPVIEAEFLVRTTARLSNAAARRLLTDAVTMLLAAGIVEDMGETHHDD
ncbi:hypothetical protein [Rhodopila sp.]|uniref:hypothetical protein n=1 Tax=Rhodopila sp. TaxID=2480087 RepID=UPI003D14D1F5